MIKIGENSEERMITGDLVGRLPHLGKDTVIKGMVHDLHLSKPELYVDNQSRGRSGHMTHAMVEVDGKVMAFNSNCSNVRLDGHSAFGYVEYRYSEDGGDHFGEIHNLQYSIDTLMDGMYIIAVEKAVVCDDGTIVAFCFRAETLKLVCCDPANTPTVIRSFDGGKTWTEAVELTGYKGRIYDALYKDGSIYVLEFCNDSFEGRLPEHQYRVFKSDDNGATFYQQSVVSFLGRPYAWGLAYGSMVFTEEGDLIVYAYNMHDEVNMAYSISKDNGKTWVQTGNSYVAKKIRNPQVGILDGQYILHGRAGGHNFVIYTSADGIHWDEGYYLDAEEGDKYGPCYYSNNIVLDNPHKPGKKRMLVQYSELYGDIACVDVMHMWIESVD